MDPGSATPAWLDQHRALLDPDEARRGAAFGRGDLRRDYVCTRILQRLVLSRAADVAPAAWRFAPAAGGKPEIVAPSQHSTIGFNVSHTKGLIALALCREGDVGIDVEALSNARDIAAVAKRFFAPEEAEALSALDECQRPLRFLTLWTLKEAYLKALGTGLAGSLDAVRFRFEADGSFTPHPVREASPWRFATLRLPPAHVLGLVWHRGSTRRDRDEAPQPRWFVPEERR